MESNGSDCRKEGSDRDSCSNGGGGIADDNGCNAVSSGGGVRLCYSNDGEGGDHNRCRAHGCCADGGIDVDYSGGGRIGGGGGKGSCGSSGSCGDDDGRADDGSSVANDTGGSESRSDSRDDGGDGGIDVMGCCRGYDHLVL